MTCFEWPNGLDTALYNNIPFLPLMTVDWGKIQSQVSLRQSGRLVMVKSGVCWAAEMFLCHPHNPSVTRSMNMFVGGSGLMLCSIR